MACAPETTPAPTSVFAPAMSPAFPRPPPASAAAHPPPARPAPAATTTTGGRIPERTRLSPPKLRLEIRDLSHPGARAFLAAVDPTECLAAAIGDVARLLYACRDDDSDDLPPVPPPTRSVTLVLRDMPGVAYTTGTELDPDHKEIHCSLGYVERIPPARAAAEVAGVLLHELVHCFQHSGRGTCPGGLVEGVADWVRLRCGLAPPHWSPGAGCSWDAGYQSTAYFLDFLDRRHGGNLVRRLNGKLRLAKYDEATFWTQLTGSSVDQLWRNYKASLGAEQPDCRDEKSSNDTDKVGSTPKMSASSSHVPYEDGGLYMSLPSPIDPVE